jgi:hypothetical protein
MSDDGAQVPSFVGTTAFCLVGPLVWAIHFGVVYGVHHVACRSTQISGRSIELVVLLASGVALAFLAAAALMPTPLAHALRAWHGRGKLAEFLVGTMRLLALLSMFGIGWAGSAALYLSACSGAS